MIFINYRILEYDSEELKQIDPINFNTNNVTNMNRMFYGCSLLKEICLSNFNTNNVTDIFYTQIYNINIYKFK